MKNILEIDNIHIQEPKGIRKLYVGAHVDDVFIGAFTEVSRNDHVKYILSTTDNIPSNKYYPGAYAFINEFGYKDVLINEIKRVLINLKIKSYFQLPIPDGKSLEHVKEIGSHIDNLIKQIQPQEIIFPTYEGGHIDHEIASAIMGNKIYPSKELKKTEYALYHISNSKFVHNEFAYGNRERIKLEKTEYIEKQNVLNIFETKKTDINYFINDKYEAIRQFEKPDYLIKPGRQLLYENIDKIRFKDFIKMIKPIIV